MMLIWIFPACQSTIEQFEIIDIVDDSYAITHREIHSLHSPRTMEGDLGNLFVGGQFQLSIEDTSLTYQTGAHARPAFSIRDGIAYPIDRDGLIAFSFYAHLEATFALLEQSDTDFSRIVPVDVAVSPIIPDITLALLPMENAAYVPSAHHFIILTDLLEKEVPLAANKGVVAHEFGHAVFHYLTTGGTTTERMLGTDALGQQSIASLDEGLADVMGYLVSDQSDFIAASLPEQNRALDTLHLAESVSSLPGEETEESLLPTYDPYALGSVFASTIWDVDQELNDKITLLNWIIRTTEQFGLDVRAGTRPDNVDLGFQWLDELINQAPSDAAKSSACTAIENHFTTVYEVLEC